MKYVRVYESDCYPEEYITTYLSYCEHVANLQDAGFDFEGCIVKQANTIEELCDYIVYNEYAENGNGKLMFKKISADFVKEQLKLVMLDGAGNVKLAILTEKGLIYVAEINDKGELELL